MEKIKFLFHIPQTATIYAGRYILNGYRNAIQNSGHTFELMSADTPNQKDLIKNYRPNIIMLGLNKYNLKYVDLEAVSLAKKNGAKIMFSMAFWTSPLSKTRINENSSLSSDKYLLDIIKSGLGDVYYNVCEQNDERMAGFEKTTGYKHYTVPLAADDSTIFPEYSEKFKADISYIGTNLPDKRPFFDAQVFPLSKTYDLKLYGQDWSSLDRALGWVQRAGQYFNVPYMKSFGKPRLQMDDERRIYNSSLISINVHEEYQRKFGGDCNERTFKIPLPGGFEISDDVACIRKYFKEGEEIIIAKDKNDWFDKIDYYIKNPKKRNSIIEAGRQRVQKDHTYKKRVKELIDIYNSTK